MIFLLSGWTVVGSVFGIAAGLSAVFFRDPSRPLGMDPKKVVSPADGVVLSIDRMLLDNTPCHHIVIFLSVFNVHVNRVPIQGTVKSITHIPGEFAAAYKNGIGSTNERVETRIDTAYGPVKVIQIAGLIARRIVCSLIPDKTVRTGERMGIIKFGSRTDLILPVTATVMIQVGDKVKGALTCVAEFPN